MKLTVAKSVDKRRKMDAVDWQIFDLRSYGRLAVEIASITGLTVNQVNYRIHRIEKKEFKFKPGETLFGKWVRGVHPLSNKMVQLQAKYRQVYCQHKALIKVHGVLLSYDGKS